MRSVRFGLVFVGLSRCAGEPATTESPPPRMADPSKASSMHLLFPAGSRADTLGLFYADLFRDGTYTYQRRPVGARAVDIATCGDVPIGVARAALDRAFLAAGLALRHAGDEWFLEEHGAAPEEPPMVVGAVRRFANPTLGEVEVVDGGFLLVTTAHRRSEALASCGTR